MRKILHFNDRQHPTAAAELSPLSPSEFEKFCKWSGANDIAFNQFLRHNNLHMLEDFHEETLHRADLKLEPGETVLDLEITYGDHDGRGCAACNKRELWRLR
jgi:hypothetical protein